MAERIYIMETTIFGILIKIAGAAMGSILSLSVLRPVNKADAFFRFMAGVIGGFVAGPLLKARYYPDLVGVAGMEVMIAYTAGVAFVAYFALSALSGTISQWETIADILKTVKDIKDTKNGNN